MKTKFNKDMYARMRNKKDEPLSALRAKSICITERGSPIIAALLSTPTPVTVGTASPTLSVKKLTPRHKKPRTGDKQKEKVDSRPSSIWDDAGVSMVQAQDVFSADDLKVLSKVPTNEVVRRHLQNSSRYLRNFTLHSSFLFFSLFCEYIYIYIFFFFLFFSFFRCWERVFISL